VLIEGEHSESSAIRKLLRSMKLLRIDDAALGRVILIARKAVRLGSPEWGDVVRLIEAGLVSDIGIDTVARVAPADGNSEQEQTAIFDLVAQAIEAAPTVDTRPTVWPAAHTRKNGTTGEVSDVAGSVQRTGQADSVLMLKADKQDGRTVASRVTFAKLREEPDDYPMPVSFAIDGDSITLDSGNVPADDRPVEERILERLQLGPRTKNKLAEELGRNWKDLEDGISALFASHRITTLNVTIRGRACKAFALRDLGRLSPDSTGRADRIRPGPTDSQEREKQGV
jgi:hypothetical protein